MSRPSGSVGRRRKAREAALVVLYQMEGGEGRLDVPVEDAIAEHCVDPQAEEFAVGLVQKTREHQDRIDALLSKAIEHWEIRRLAAIDRCILRMAVCEFVNFPDIPFRVTIDEAIEVSDKYSTGQSSAFVNGVLDRVAEILGLGGERRDEG